MLKIATEFVSAKVRSHTFRWVPCHTDKNRAWAAALSKWRELSPWRVQ